MPNESSLCTWEHLIVDTDYTRQGDAYDMENAIGIIHKNQFYQLILNKTPTSFKENIRKMEARLPRSLNFTEDEEGRVILISWDENSPAVGKTSEVLPTEIIDQLLQKSMEQPCSFLPSTVGGSVNERS